MKIKNDFVTNSSSCSYIVCIPNMNKFLKDLSEKIEIPYKFVDAFRNSKMYIDFDLDECDDEFDQMYNMFGKMHDIIAKMGYIIEFDEWGPDNAPRYINIAHDKDQINNLKKILKEDT